MSKSGSRSGRESLSTDYENGLNGLRRNPLNPLLKSADSAVFRLTYILALRGNVVIIRSNVLNAGIKTARRRASSRCWIDDESNELRPLEYRSRGEQESGEREEDKRNSPIEIDGLSLHGEPPSV